MEKASILLSAVLLSASILFTACTNAQSSLPTQPSGSTSVEGSTPSSSMTTSAHAQSDSFSISQSTLTPCESSPSDLETIKNNAMTLFDHIVKHAITVENHVSLPKEQVYVFENVYAFVMSLPVYIDDPTHPYAEFVHKGTEYIFAFMYGNDVKEMVYELLGVEDWDEYEEILPDGEMGYLLQAGTGIFTSNMDYKETDLTTAGNQLSIEFNLIASQAYSPDDTEYGRFKMTFEYVTDGNHCFLRYGGLNRVSQ